LSGGDAPLIVIPHRPWLFADARYVVDVGVVDERAHRLQIGAARQANLPCSVHPDAR
jgi:hypothetical protein